MVTTLAASSRTTLSGAPSTVSVPSPAYAVQNNRASASAARSAADNVRTASSMAVGAAGLSTSSRRSTRCTSTPIVVRASAGMPRSSRFNAFPTTTYSSSPSSASVTHSPWQNQCLRKKGFGAPVFPARHETHFVMNDNTYTANRRRTNAPAMPSKPEPARISDEGSGVAAAATGSP